MTLASTDQNAAQGQLVAVGLVEAQGEPRRDRWFSLAVLVSGIFMTTLDLFIVNVALERIRQNLHASPADLQLVMVAYSAAYGVFLMNCARLGDLFGRKRLFLIGTCVFTVASALCGAAPSAAFLVTARVLQGIGAALLMPQVLATIRVLFEGEARPKAFSIMGIVQGLASPIAQIGGGLLVTYDLFGLGWRLVFLINVPVGLAMLLLGSMWIIETRAPVPARLDIKGAIILASGLLALFVPFLEGQDRGWPWWSIVLPLSSVAIFYLFARFEAALVRRGQVPIFDITMLSNHRLLAGVIGVFLFFASISSFFLSLTLLLQAGLGYTPLVAGLIFTPTALAFITAARLSPAIVRQMGGRSLLLGVGAFFIGLTLSVLVAFFVPTSAPLLVASLIFNGFGQGLTIPLALNANLSTVPDAQAGMASGMVGTMQTLGAAFGVAIVGVIFFADLSEPLALTLEARAHHYGHALGTATYFNLFATALSALCFLYLIRTKRT
ncbi:MFS family permease [Bradyrhizobium sp. USDA 4524]|uniref:MFS transporter n=1 Tax=unclassified Bradyrhizobium TaxID=2631580 RepID=UPI00209D77D4|nr:MULTISPECIES: MFS transporter [unclassified Bradyrhizobium]MCP1845814.1 MFS family permease [Bradyrhizobium sp. USDA 4538]MCP1906863.1 MFS family permease [Bradyrhizobium sp. USDA 4537]MCP1985338.1 MFS family permease [Bradyrhizobium sp. USDA 4539]